MPTTDEATRHRKFVPLPIDPLELVARAKALLEEPVSAETMPAFVAAVNEVSVDFSELYASRMRANDEDTADEAAKQSYLDFLTNHVPELAGLSPDEIHAPWQTVPLRLKSLGYPEPVVDHKARRLRALKMYKAVKG